jgi:hypothetical protein
MTRRLLAFCVAAVCSLAGRGLVYGQAEDAFCEGCYHEQQWFAPVNFDYDCLPIDRGCGYFFHYSRLSWAITGERTPLGNGATDNGSLNPFREYLTGRAGSATTPPTPVGQTPLIIAPPDFLGGVDSGPPRASFGWGDRYEIGYFEGDHGWKVGIIDNAHSSDNQSYGLTTQNSLYGSVLVPFSDPQNLMFGFLDVWNGALGSGGPFRPDGNADDIDNDGQFGPNGYDLDDPAQVPDSNFPGDTRADFDDLVRLPTSWQFVNVRNSTRVDGIEIMKTYRLDNSHFMTKHQNNSFEVAAGVRYLRIRDRQTFDGFGGVMGTSFFDSRVDNNIVGPQIEASWTYEQNRWNFDLDGRFIFGADIQNFNFNSGFGSDFVPGQFNRPIYFPATVTNLGKQQIFFSPTAELRAEARYKITKALAAKLGYTAIFADNISRAAAQVRYELPRMGFRPDQAGAQTIFINGADFGFELVY